jgi:beta-phosphoglucomutase-like phosphatase (HAD superfamily)
MMKPDPEMFHHVIRTIGTTADRLLFFDDCNDHVLAARKLGIRAEQTRGVSEVQDTLVSLLPADSRAGRAVRSLPLRPQAAESDASSTSSLASAVMSRLVCARTQSRFLIRALGTRACRG